MKKTLISCSTAALALALMIAFGAFAPAAPSVMSIGSETPTPDVAIMPISAPVPEPYAIAAGGSLNVTGQGSVKCKPDTAYLSFGVQTEAADAKTAQEDNAKRMEDVVKAVKALGIKDEDIQSSGYSLYPNYDYGTNYTKSPRIVGYTVSNNISVTLRDIDLTGKALDAAVQAGANLSGGISFGISDREGAYLKALEAAINNAETKAGAMASVLGVTIGLPLEVTEQSAYNSYRTYYDMGYPEMAVADSAAAAPSYQTPIEAGELEVTATVTVRYGY